MKKNGATVYFAAGFHKVWKEATHRSLKLGHWSRNGWQTCNPLKQFISEDVNKLIKNQLKPVEANIGDIIIFSPFLPHGPNLNAFKYVRIAAYNYYGRLTSNVDESNFQNAECYLPNSITKVANSVLFGTCPKYAAHPWSNYALHRNSINFYSKLPYRSALFTNLAKSLFGIQSWQFFEKSEEANIIFNTKCDINIQKEMIFNMQSILIENLSTLNNETEIMINNHEKHQFDNNCILCLRKSSASLSQWWHSSDAIIHQKRHCKCILCKTVKQKGWKSIRDKKGCNCLLCQQFI